MSDLAYATVLSGDKQLPGIIVLARSLRKHGCRFPFSVLITEDVSPQTKIALKSDAEALQIIIEEIQTQKNDSEQSTSPQHLPHPILHIFSPPLWKYETICYLSPSAIILRKGLDLVFTEAHLPADNWIAAPFLCTCDSTPSSAKGKARWDVPHAPRPSLTDGGESSTCPYRELVPRKRSFSWMPHGTQGNEEVGGKVMDGRMLVFYPGERLWSLVLTGLDGEAKNEGDYGPRQPDTQPDTWKLLDRIVGKRWIALPGKYFGGEGQCHYRPSSTGIGRFGEVVHDRFPVAGIYRPSSGRPHTTMVGKEWYGIMVEWDARQLVPPNKILLSTSSPEESEQQAEEGIRNQIS